MTDRIDYTQRPEVLAACGWHFDENEEEWVKGDRDVAFGAVCCDEMPVLTMQELWEGLCRVCELEHHRWWPELRGILTVLVFPYGSSGETFTVKEHGTLSNAIAAALYYVLQQGKEHISGSN